MTLTTILDSLAVAGTIALLTVGAAAGTAKTRPTRSANIAGVLTSAPSQSLPAASQNGVSVGVR